MKLNTMAIQAALALVLASSALADADCSYEGGFVHKWRITATGVDGIPGYCGGLWDNMKTFQGDCPISNAWCGGDNGNLEWTFTTSNTCGPGAVESAWWEATSNKFGSIVCGH